MTESPSTAAAVPATRTGAPVALPRIDSVPVEDDPKQWPNWKKNIVLAMVSLAAIAPMLNQSIYSPVIDQLQEDLGADDVQLSLTLSLYILAQGIFPLLWSTVAELLSRKPIYIISFAIGTGATAIASRATSIQLMIAMRVIQGAGGAAVLSVGAGSIADVFDIHERGRKMGVYNAVPLVAPSLAPLLGGALGNAYGWRSTFYLLVVFSGIATLAFIFFPDSWRRERSAVFQRARVHALVRARSEEAEQRSVPVTRAGNSKDGKSKDEASLYEGTTPSSPIATSDLEKVAKEQQTFTKKSNAGLRVVGDDGTCAKIQLDDCNPFPLVWKLASSPQNAMVVVASGFLFSSQYAITFTSSKSLAESPYSYSPLHIGLVQLSYGAGGMVGSMLGGRISDTLLARERRKNPIGEHRPELRLKAIIWATLPLIMGFVAYGWLIHYHLSIGGIAAVLFLNGASMLTAYSGVTTYLVEANPGQSSIALGLNGLARGIFACIISQTALPIRSAIGDGGLYSIIGGLLSLATGLLVFVIKTSTVQRKQQKRQTEA